MEEIIKGLQGKIEVTLLHLEQLKFNETVVQNQIVETNKLLNKLQNQLEILTNSPITIKLSDYFTPEELKEYNPTCDMLFEPDMYWQDWLDWFYEELPFIKDKHLILTGLNSGKNYSITEIPYNSVVKTDYHYNRITVLTDEPVILTLGQVNLFKLLSV